MTKNLDMHGSDSVDTPDSFIADFLGKQAAIGGPFALLGLRHEPIDQSKILYACQIRLMQINEHRRSQTPAADEVRLAVHAAGSQLLDPALRRELAKHWPEGSGMQSFESPEAWKVSGNERLDSKLLAQALTVLGACGGWNARSRKRLGQFARWHQVSASQLVSGILDSQNPQQTQGVNSLGGYSSETRGPTLVDDIDGAIPWSLIPVAYTLMGLALISVSILKHQQPVQHVEDTRPPESAAESFVPSSREAGKLAESARFTERRHYSAIIHELDRFRTSSILDEASAMEFSDLGHRLIEQWTEFDPSELDQAVHSVQFVLGGIISSELFDQACAFLNIPVDGIDEPLLADGLRSLFFGKIGNAPSISAMSQTHARAQASSEFAAHLSDAFTNRASKSVDDPDWWRWWIVELEGIEKRSEVRREQLLYASVYSRMSEPIMGDQWDRSVRSVVLALDWGDGESSRGWVLGLIANPEVRSDRLAALTKALALYSSASGLGTEFVLNPDDSLETRELYLAKLRSAWATSTENQDEIRDRLLAEMKIQISMTRSGIGQEQAVLRAYDFARLNTACWARHADNQLLLQQLVGSIGNPMPVHQQGGLELDLGSPAGDEQWATDARNLTDTDALSEHLSALSGFQKIGPKSAHALVYLAMLAPDLQIRADAERALLSRPDDPAILIALDRVAGSSKPSRRMIQLIHEYVMSDVESGDQEVARKALLQRLVKIGVLNDSDHITTAQSFEQAMVELVEKRGTRSLHDGARGVYEDFSDEMIQSGMVVPASVRAQLLVRLRVAQGPMQQFIAYESAALELFAHKIRSENPGMISIVDQIMDESQEGQNETAYPEVQLMIIERAMTRLWAVLFEMESVS